MTIPSGAPNGDHFPTNACVVGDSACQSRDNHFPHDNGSQTVNHGMSDAETPTTVQHGQGDFTSNQDKLVMVDDRDSDEEVQTGAATGRSP